MKKYVLFFLLISVGLTSWSQERTHEFKFDALGFLATPSVEITYEHALNIHSGIGVSSYFRIDPPSSKAYEAFSLAPFYRQYFYDNRTMGNKGFFIEALFQYTNGEGEADNSTDDDPIFEDYSDIGIGFGGGVKWITPNGFTVEGVVGIGRNFKTDDLSNDIFFRWGINLGYRFF